MAERRAIKSKIWEDEFFGELSILAQLIWIGIFSRCVDDQGRMAENPSIIKSQLFPYKDISIDDISKCLDEFNGHIIRYEVGGRKYIQIEKWKDNQPLQYAVPSNYPAPKGWIDRYKTYYKGMFIIYNWIGKDGEETNDLGKKIHDTLESLGRVSSWTDYVGTLNTNLNPNPINKKILPKSKPKSAPAKKPAGNLFQIAHALSSVTGLDYEKNQPRIYKAAKSFKPGEEQQIIREYGLGGLWYKNDWRGQKGQKPTLEQVIQTWNNLNTVIPEKKTELSQFEKNRQVAEEFIQEVQNGEV